MKAINDHVNNLINISEKMFEDKTWDIIYSINHNNATLLTSREFYDFVLPYYKFEVTINLSMDKLIEPIWNATKETLTFDEPTLEHFSVIEEKPSYKIKRQINKFPWPCWSRETLYAQHKIKKDNITWIVSYSIDHKEIPIVNDLVRTYVGISVYKFTLLEQNKTLVQRVLNVDPGGWIPPFIIKSQLENVIKIFNRWESLGKKQIKKD